MEENRSFKKKLRYIFELRFFPNLSMFLFRYEQWFRRRVFKLFLRAVDPDKTKNIIDIGGGAGRLEKELSRKDIFIYDNHVVDIKKAREYFSNTKVGSGSKIDFPDNSFDWAFSLHTLEHIPKKERGNFILEMLRISKEGIFLNFPEGKYAEKICIEYLEALKKNGKPPNKWTIEHLEHGLPLIEEIIKELSRQDKFVFRYKGIRNYNIEKHYWTKISASGNLIKKYLFTPLISVLGYICRNRYPSGEILLVGTKGLNYTQSIINKI